MNTESQQAAASLSPGACAVLELRLSDARRDLALAVERRNADLGQADVFKALGYEATTTLSRVGRNAACVKYQLHAAEGAREIYRLEQEIAGFEALLAGKAEAPVALTVDQCAAMDSTMGALA